MDEHSLVSKIINNVRENGGDVRLLDRSRLMERVSMLLAFEEHDKIVESLSSESLLSCWPDDEVQNSDSSQILGACALPQRTGLTFLKSDDDSQSLSKYFQPLSKPTGAIPKRNSYNKPPFSMSYDSQSLPKKFQPLGKATGTIPKKNSNNKSSVLMSNDDSQSQPKQFQPFKKTTTIIPTWNSPYKRVEMKKSQFDLSFDDLSDSSDSSDDEDFVDEFMRSMNDSSTAEKSKSSKTFHSSDSDLCDTSLDDEWVASHCNALYTIFPNLDRLQLRERCMNLNHDDVKFADLIKDISSGVENYDEYQSELQLALLLSTEEAGNVKEPEILVVGCGICFDDYEFHEMFTCSGNDAHMFCIECLGNYVKVEIGESNYDIKCLDSECTSLYSQTVLQIVLEPKMFNIMMNKKQQVEIDTAGLENLESCPFCHYGHEFSEKVTLTTDYPVLQCYNPDCMKRTCRLCKKEDHRPEKCDENDAQKDARTRLENEMTEAMIRKCYKCGRRFIKKDGCNRMTCTCGASMCYLCKEPTKDYNHFKNGGCSLYTSDLNELHTKEVNERAEQVKKTLDPNLLLHDPTAK